MAFFRFKNDLYGIDLDSNLIAGLQFKVRKFEGITSTSATITEERLIGMGGTNVLGVAVNGREINIELEIVDCEGSTNDCISKLALFFGVGNKIWIYSDANSGHNIDVSLEGFVSKFDIARYGNSLKNLMVVSLEMYCPNPYWTYSSKIPQEGVRTPVTYSSELNGYILFEYESGLCNVPTPIRARIDFTDEWLSGKTQVTYDYIKLIYAKNDVYSYGQLRYNEVMIHESFPLGSSLTFDTDFNHPYCFKTKGVPISSFYENSYMALLPEGACIRCVGYTTQTNLDVPDIRVAIERDYYFI